MRKSSNNGDTTSRHVFNLALDIAFFVVLIFTTLYIAADVFGCINLEKSIVKIFLMTFIYGSFVVFFLSGLGLFLSKKKRFRWYLFVSVLEVISVVIVYVVVRGSHV